MNKIIGREREIELLKEIWSSSSAEFLAVYGRRRVGKTYLIRNFFQPKGFYIEFTGIKDGHKHEHLERFTDTMVKKFYPLSPSNDFPDLRSYFKSPATWHAAFEWLSQELEKFQRQKKLRFFLMNYHGWLLKNLALFRRWIISGTHAGANGGS